MVTGKFGLMVRVMGTSAPQTLTSQAKAICLEISRMNPASFTCRSAIIAVRDHKHLEFVQDMAFQILDYQKALAEVKNQQEDPQENEVEKFKFNEALDAWILELDEQIKLSKS